MTDNSDIQVFEYIPERTLFENERQSDLSYQLNKC